MRATLALVALVALGGVARADMSFHVDELLVEDEVRPRQAHHQTLYHGDFYVTDKDVSVSGFEQKSGGPIPFNEVMALTSPHGQAHTTVFRRVPNGVEEVIEYDSFILTRRMLQTGPQSCTDYVSDTLKPGFHLYETRRHSNGEAMFDAKRSHPSTRCSFPNLIY